jgi:hypothetical protein
MQMYKLNISIYVLYLRQLKVVICNTVYHIKRESGLIPELFPQL